MSHFKHHRLVGTALYMGVALLSNAAMAYEAGDVIARVGTHYVDPKSGNNDTVGVDASYGITGSLVYFVTPTLAADLLLAVPYQHDVTLNSNGSDVASVRHLPPTLSLAWYPALGDTWKPFVGVGLNYTTFFDEKTEGALAGTRLELDDSFGIAFVAGLQVDVTPQWGVTLDARYFDIDTDASVNGGSVGVVEIDPIGLGASVSYRF